MPRLGRRGRRGQGRCASSPRSCAGEPEAAAQLLRRPGSTTLVSLLWSRQLTRSVRAAEDAAKHAVALSGEQNHEVGVAALLLLGEVAREDDERRAALERALVHILEAGARAEVLAGIGEMWHRQRRDHDAVLRWQEAVATDPACLPAQLALAREEQQAGLLGAAFARLQGLPKEARRCPRWRAPWPTCSWG